MYPRDLAITVHEKSLSLSLTLTLTLAHSRSIIHPRTKLITCMRYFQKTHSSQRNDLCPLFALFCLKLFLITAHEAFSKSKRGGQ